MKITVVGGTGYAGAHLVTEAHQRGHAVTAISRTASAATSPAGPQYLVGDALDEATLVRAVEQSDVVLSALAPRGPLAGRTRGVIARLAEHCTVAGARLGVVGGAGSLRTAAGGPMLMDTDALPEQFKAEAREMSTVLDDLRASGEDAEWFYISPAAGFGPWEPGTRTGTYRTGSDLLLTDQQGHSLISGADLAVAVLDEVESPKHRQARFTVAY